MKKRYIKTIEGKTKEEIDKKANEFADINKVFATQTHVDYIAGAKHFTYILFFETEE